MSTKSDSFDVHAVFPNYYDGTRVSYSLAAILEFITGPGLQTHTYVLGKANGVGNEVSALLPLAGYRYSSKLVTRPADAIVKRFGRRMRPRDVVYFWLSNPPLLCQALQDRKLVVIREMINCTLARRREELTKAYGLLGLPDGSGISDAHIAQERSELLAADGVFCPNEQVFESVVACGVPASRCMRTSYGWSPARIAGNTQHLTKAAGLNLLFVGTAEIRKGFPWLLRAWEKAGVQGRLLIAGSIDPDVRNRYARLLQRPDVCDLGYVVDVGAVYRSADAFCFPTWEEGGPMVTIEAIGAGLPCIVTPMGTAGILSEQAGGALIVPPGDVDALAVAIRRMALDHGLRTTAAQSARHLAARYTWQEVGKRRREAIVRLRDQVARP